MGGEVEAKGFEEFSCWWHVSVLIMGRDFPGGTVVKNLPANAGNMGSSPGPGRSHVPRRTPRAAEQLSQCATTTEPAL